MANGDKYYPLAPRLHLHEPFRRRPLNRLLLYLVN